MASTFVVNSGATSSDIEDAIDEKLAQLEAQTLVIYGVGAETFHGWSLQTKDNYLWAINENVCQLQMLNDARRGVIGRERVTARPPATADQPDTH